MEQSGKQKLFRGSYPAKLDDRGRLKIPARYLSIFEEIYGNDLYVTSLNGDYTMLYPLDKWSRIEETLGKMMVHEPDVNQFLDMTSFWGNESVIDSRGRVLIPPGLRTESKLDDGVRVVGKIDHIVVWNEQIFKTKVMDSKFTDGQLQNISRILNELSASSSIE